MEVRLASLSDAEQIHDLLAELGYAPDADEFVNQFEIYLNSSQTRIWVAADPLHRLSGVISACLIPLLHEAGNLGRITALVVSSTDRGSGIGSALVSTAEVWFLTQNCVRMEVTSGEARLRTHAFYEERGFAVSGKRFVKRRSAW